VNNIYLRRSCSCMCGIFPDHIYHPTYPQFLRKVFMCHLFPSTHKTNKSSVLLNSASASICFVMWTNCNR
jgi:hypothetical protein